jgi:hypothetical protein
MTTAFVGLRAWVSRGRLGAGITRSRREEDGGDHHHGREPTEAHLTRLAVC